MKQILALFLTELTISNLELISKCSDKNSFYNLLSSECTLCPLNSIPSQYSCACQLGSIKSVPKFGYKNMCIPCSSYQGNDYYQSQCQSCTENECFPQNPNQIFLRREYNGYSKIPLSIIKCQKGYMANETKDQCIKMQDGQYYDDQGVIKCDDGYTIDGINCYETQLYQELNTKFDFDVLTEIQLNDEEKFISSILVSDLFNDTYQCVIQRKSNVKYCDKLYNYCMMMDFDKAIKLCQLYEYVLKKFPLKKINDQEYNYITPLDLQLNEISINQELKIYISTIDDSGELQSTTVKFQDLLICKTEILNFKFNFNQLIKCSFDLNSLNKEQFTSLQFLILDDQNIFNVIPIFYNIDNKEIDNILDNYISQTYQQKLYMYNGQFFRNEEITYIKYIDKIQLKVFISDNKNYILIEIHPKIKKIENERQYIQQIFEINFYEENSTVLFALKISFGLTHILIIGIIILRIIIWGKNNPQNDVGETYYLYIFGNYVWIIIKTWGQVVFLYLCISSIILFIFYHFSENQLFTFPIKSSNQSLYQIVMVIFHIVFIIYLFILIEIVVKLSKCKTMFLDWERKELEIELPSQLHEDQSQEGVQTKRKIKSAWRSILIGNEFFELSIDRRIRIEIIILIYLVVMQLSNIEKYKCEYQNIDNVNIILNFALQNSVLLIIGFFLYILVNITDLIKGNPIENFLDLLSLSNISLLIFNRPQQAYYIHGENNTGSSEGSMIDLQKNLLKESKGFLSKRGLQQNDKEELQTFQVYIPIDFERFLENVYHSEIKTQIYQKMNNLQYQSQMMNYQENQTFMNDIRNVQNQQQRKQNFVDTFLNDNLPINLNYNRIFEKKEIIINSFKLILLRIHQNKENCFRKGFMNRVLDTPVIDLRLGFRNPIFVRDEDQKFQEILFIGQEISNLFVLLVIFQIVNLWTSLGLLSLFIVYLIDYGRHWIMSEFMKVSFSRSSLINEAFLSQLIISDKFRKVKQGKIFHFLKTKNLE